MVRAELNKKFTSHLCGQQRGLKCTRFKIHRNLGKKRSWHLKSRHFVVLDSIFLFPVFLRRKSFFLKIFWRLFCNRKATRETLPRSNRMEVKTCKRLKIRFPRQSLAHAKTLFSSLHRRRSGIGDRALTISGKTPQIGNIM